METTEQSNNSCNNQFNCSFLDSLPTVAKDIISWRCPIASGAILSAVVVLSLMIKFLSFVSVVAYIGLFFILTSFLLRFYSSFIQSQSDHPLAPYLDRDIHHVLARLSLLIDSQITDHNSRLNRTVAYLTDIFLLNNYANALKFFFVNLALVYVGMYFNLIDLVLAGAVFVLVGPRIYCSNRAQIDAFVSKVSLQTAAIIDLVKEKMATIPIIGGKQKQV